MNKKIKYLMFIPLYGICILLIYLFVQCLKEKISKRKFGKIFLICGIVSAICWYMVLVIVFLVSKKLIFFDFNELGIILTIIIAGYMANLFTFKLIEYKWEYLFMYDEKEKQSVYEVNKKIIFLGALLIATAIIIIALIMMSVYGLI